MSNTSNTLAAWKQQLRGQAGIALQAIKALAKPKRATEIQRYLRTLMLAEKMMDQFWGEKRTRAVSVGSSDTDASLPPEIDLDAAVDEVVAAAETARVPLNRQQRRWLERRERKAAASSG